MFSWSWNDSYSIGIQTIDEQHKQLIKIAGKLQDMLQAGDSVDYYDYIIEAINELKDYTKYHFGYEEEKLKEFNYPDYEDHRMQHLYFVDKIELFPNSVYNITLRCDVLESFKDDILASSGFINQQSQNVNKYYNSNYQSEVRKEVDLYKSNVTIPVDVKSTILVTIGGV